MLNEGAGTPPEKSEREKLLEELAEINSFIEKWGPLYMELVDKGEEIRKETKYLTESQPEDEEHLNQLLEQFFQAIGEGRNIESVKSLYIQNLNRKLEIEEKLREMEQDS